MEMNNIIHVKRQVLVWGDLPTYSRLEVKVYKRTYLPISRAKPWAADPLPGRQGAGTQGGAALE